MAHMSANYQSLVREAAMVIPGAQNFPVTYDMPAGATEPVATVNRASLVRAMGAKIDTENKTTARPGNNRHQKYERAFAAQRHAPRPSARAGILAQSAGTQSRLDATLKAHTPNATIAQANMRIASTNPAPATRALSAPPETRRKHNMGLRLATVLFEPASFVVGAALDAFNKGASSPTTARRINSGADVSVGGSESNNRTLKVVAKGQQNRQTGVAATYAKLGVGLPTPTFG